MTSDPPASRLARLDDGELLRLAGQDPRGPAFRALHARHADDVFRYQLRLVRDRSLAEDALQETFLRVHEHLDRCDPGRPFRPWLFRVARNVGLNLLRSRARERAKSTGELERPTSDRVARVAATAEQTRDVRAALEALDDAQRALLIERHGLGLRLEELASSWECTERTVRNRLHAAVDALTRVLLERRRGGGA